MCVAVFFWERGFQTYSEKKTEKLPQQDYIQRTLMHEHKTSFATHTICEANLRIVQGIVQCSML